MSTLTFVEKSADELGKMETDALVAYYNEKNAYTRHIQDEMLASKASKEDVQKVADSLREDLVKQMSVLNQSLKEQNSALKLVMNERTAQVKSGSISDQIKASLTENLDSLKAMKDGYKGKRVKIEIKAAGDMTIAGNVSGGNVPVEDRVPGLNALPSRSVRLLDVVSTRPTSSGIVSWVDQANIDGGSAQVAEAGAKPQFDFDLVVASQAVKKTAVHAKVSMEMLDDVPGINAFIRQELIKNLLKAVETQVYSGDNTGNNLNGVRTVATAFAAGTFANTVDNANAVDVLVVAANQIKIAEHDMPTAILMHPSDVTALKLVKMSSTDKRYIERLTEVAGTLRVDGIPIIETTLVTVDDYLIGTFGNAVLNTRQTVSVDIGFDGNDFTNNMSTIRAEWRGLLYVTVPNRTAFVAGDFSTDAAALETP